jgi:hypothetical protein
MVKVKISVLAALLLLTAAVRGSELPPRNSRELMDERELQETDAPSAAPEQPNLAREYTRLTCIINASSLCDSENSVEQ